jgi:hypothetical protein
MLGAAAAARPVALTLSKRKYHTCFANIWHILGELHMGNGGGPARAPGRPRLRGARTAERARGGGVCLCLLCARVPAVNASTCVYLRINLASTTHGGGPWVASTLTDVGLR